MVLLSRPMMPRIALIAAVVLLVLPMQIVSANDPIEDAKPTMVAISLLSLPIMGLIILLIIAIPAMLGRPYRVEPVGFHLANLLAVVFLLAFIDALLAPYVFAEGVDPALSFSVVGVLDMLIVTGVFVRYLLHPVNLATVIGTVLAVITVLRVYSAYQMPLATLYHMEDVLRFTLPAWVFLFSGLLMLETVRNHHLVDEGHKEPDWPQVHKEKRMMRLGEVLIMTFAVAVAMGLVWL
jgi:hypothetical protein